MEIDFWHERWKNGQIGFHQNETNAYLLKHWQNLSLSKDSLVFVPMAGKTTDILWLISQGFKVIANELSEKAVNAFFNENDISFTVNKTENFNIYLSENLTFYCGDFFKLPTDKFKDVKGVFDRASLVAMPENMRQSYQKKMCELLSIDVNVLLVTMEYPQSQMDGPPFSVSENEVNLLFSNKFDLSLLETFDVLAENPRFIDKGLTSMLEKVYLMKAKNIE